MQNTDYDNIKETFREEFRDYKRAAVMDIDNFILHTIITKKKLRELSDDNLKLQEKIKQLEKKNEIITDSLSNMV